MASSYPTPDWLLARIQQAVDKQVENEIQICVNEAVVRLGKSLPTILARVGVQVSEMVSIEHTGREIRITLVDRTDKPKEAAP